MQKMPALLLHSNSPSPPQELRGGMGELLCSSSAGIFCITE
jgi:hypothetical protein